jgi:hypothetical protein
MTPPATIDDVIWLEPWALLEAQGRDALERELRRELIAGHVLFGREARAIARREDQDDVLFMVEAPEQLAVVHLTYVRDTRPEFPHTMIFETIAQFIEACMLPDHAELTDDDVD